MAFLANAQQVETSGGNTVLDTRNWVENWVSDTSVAGQELAPPVAIEFRLELADQGEMRRIYALPPL